MEDENELKLKYVKEFYKDSYLKAVWWCTKWNGTNGKYFRDKQPEDFVIEVLEKILLKEAKCYLKSFKHFEGSVYYYLKYAMLNFFSPDNIREIIDPFEESDITFDGELIDNNHLDIINNIEKEELYENIINILQKEGNEIEYFVFDLILKDYSREEIARELGLSVNDVTNAKKRLQRKLEKILKRNKTLERTKINA